MSADITTTAAAPEVPAEKDPVTAWLEEFFNHIKFVIAKLLLKFGIKTGWIEDILG